MDRRTFLQRTTLAGFAAWDSRLLCADEAVPRSRLPIAGVVTHYTTNSHADVILGKVLQGFDQQGGPGPALKLVSLYTDQVPKNDLSRGLAEKHGFRIAKTIEEAITLGSDELPVAGVLSIGEHGNYPYTPDTNQHMYPRRRFFDEIAASFRRVGKVVPVFNDKHLSYRWSDARHMADTATAMRIPLMAGSSLPVTWRRPPLALPLGCQLESALAVGYGGLESYGFHALETLQCMIERRAGGESGVVAVQAVQGDAIWQALDDGKWSLELLQAALNTTPNVKLDDLRARLGKGAAFYLIEHRDGLNSTVAMANGVARHFAFAARIRGQREPVATWFELEDEKPFSHFAYLTRAIDEMIHTGKPSYPVERTLLTTGVLDHVMHSLALQGQRRDTPELDVQYQAVDWPFANA